MLLDTFCKAGGCTRGYQMAGFYVIGIDHEPQPHYVGDGFLQMDALEALRILNAGGRLTFSDGVSYGIADIAAIHASPPCQRYTSLNAMWNSREHPDLVAPTRELLMATGLPYVIENVPHAPLLNGIVLCGTMFDLGCEGAELRRHRIFESNVVMMAPATCKHGWSAQTVAVDGHSGGWSNRVRKAATIGVYGGHGRDRRRRMNGENFPTSSMAQAMGIDWMVGTELSQAIPPVYTYCVGGYLLEHLHAD